MSEDQEPRPSFVVRHDWQRVAYYLGGRGKWTKDRNKAHPFDRSRR
jgi:hypothetical protein